MDKDHSIQILHLHLANFQVRTSQNIPSCATGYNVCMILYTLPYATF